MATLNNNLANGVKPPLTEKEKRALRLKELATIKAENQLLEDAKRNLIALSDEAVSNNGKYAGVQDLSKHEKITALEIAQKENLEFAKNSYGATMEEIENMEYNDASPEVKAAYERRLKMKGMTDEQIRNKKISSVDYNGNSNSKDTDSPDDGLIEDYSGRRGNKSSIKAGRRKRVTIKPKKMDQYEYTQYEEKAPEITVVKETVEEAKAEKIDVEKEVKVVTSQSSNEVNYDFDISSIPEYVQWDAIKLPSMGQCYPHKKSRLPVAYLTGADENIIASPNMYRDGKLIDVILKRKILDKTINIDELCTGDRDAIILWLRATAYGTAFPITATNPANGKQYDTTVDLSKFEYNKFNLIGDENGLFEYTIGDNVLKFKFLTKSDENILRETLVGQISDSNKISILRNAVSIKECLSRVNVTDEERNNINEDIDEITEIVGGVKDEVSEEELFPKTVTEQMVVHTVSINGNTDRNYIRRFIENMRAGDARKYRDYIVNNRPGVDFNVKISIPESDGGGSFSTFLRLDDSIFITY